MRIATASEQRNKAMCSRSSEEIHSLRFRLRQKAPAANCAWFIPSSSPNKRKFLLLGTHYAHRHIALFFLSPLKVKPSMGTPGRLAMTGAERLQAAKAACHSETSPQTGCGNPYPSQSALRAASSPRGGAKGGRIAAVAALPRNDRPFGPVRLRARGKDRGCGLPRRQNNAIRPCAAARQKKFTRFVSG